MADAGIACTTPITSHRRNPSTSEPCSLGFCCILRKRLGCRIGYYRILRLCILHVRLCLSLPQRPNLLRSLWRDPARNRYRHGDGRNTCGLTTATILAARSDTLQRQTRKPIASGSMSLDRSPAQRRTFSETQSGDALLDYNIISCTGSSQQTRWKWDAMMWCCV